ncbi:MAG: ankyrin repeat protein, partial [Enterobacterales bacterium]
MESLDDNNKTVPMPTSENKNGQWRKYRILAGILTLFVGMNAGGLLISINSVGQAYNFLGGIMSGRGANYGGLLPGSGILFIAGMILLPFLIGGLFYCGKKGRGRLIVWIAALFSVPITIYSIYLSYLMPGFKPSGELSSIIIALLISIYMIWVLIKTVPGKHKSTPSKRFLATFAATILMAAIGYVTWGYFMVREPDLIYKVVGRANEAIALLEQGADPNQRSQNGVTPLMHALEAQHNSDILIALLDAGADPSQTSKFIWADQLMRWLYPGTQITPEHLKWEHTPLIVAIKFQSPSVAKLMIEKGANVNPEKANMLEKSPLILAIKHHSRDGDINLITTLINHGATVEPDILVKSNALTQVNTEELTLLIDKGADVNAKKEGIHTPLMQAVKTWDIETVQLLLDHGADLQQVSGKHTPLQWVENLKKNSEERGRELHD